MTVFSLGDVSSCNRELVLTGSLFDPDTFSHSHLPPLAEHLLAAKPEYAAVWFTYEYYDVGREHAVEVCTERLSVGEIAVLLSPDVVHRVTYFTSAYGESLKAYPLFSEGTQVVHVHVHVHSSPCVYHSWVVCQTSCAYMYIPC